MNDVHQKEIVARLEKILIAFFVLAALSLIIVYVLDPSIYTKTLLIAPSPTDRHPLSATLFLIGILIFIIVLIFGVMRHWRWLFWLMLLAFGFSILDIPVTILQLIGVLPTNFPLWYSLYRMIVAIIEVGIAIWMVQVYRQYGIWAMGKKRKVININQHKSSNIKYH